MNLYRFIEPIYITKPLVPESTELFAKIQKILDNRLLTNNGPFLIQLEKDLKIFLGLNNLLAVNNGSTALELSSLALKLTGEVITTPFTFPATPHAFYLNKVKPIFCDISPIDLNIDPNLIESLITEKTSAIAPVHVFGNPCDHQKISDITQRHNLKLVYDAAHSFGVEYNNKTIVDWGDCNILSFHATKIFNTVEGGAVIFKDDNVGDILSYLRNFGIINETTIVSPGKNAKLNEVQAVFGSLVLRLVKEEIAKRENISLLYRQHLNNCPGINFIPEKPGVKYNYQYMPILVDKAGYGRTRNDLYSLLKEYNVFSRRYFYPLCSDIPFYKHYQQTDFPVARKISEQILCLPIFGDLTEEAVYNICNIIKFYQK